MAENLEFITSFEGEADKNLLVSAYAFDRKGQLIASAPVKDGKVKLSIEEEQAKTARIFFAPMLEGKREQPVTLDIMEKVQAYESGWVYSADKKLYNILPIPQSIWICWIWAKCRVRGKVVKPVTVNGVSHNMPVFHARVHICEVDPLPIILRRLPDDAIIRLRDELIRVIEKPTPFPEPEPDPVFSFDPEVVDLTPKSIALMNKVVVNEHVIKSEPRLNIDRITGDKLTPFNSTRLSRIKPDHILSSKLRDMELDPIPSVIMPASISIPAELKVNLMSPSPVTVRNALSSNINFVKPFLIRFPWIWPYFYRCDHVAVVESDLYGRFEADFWYLRLDKPDLYFWVEYCIGGVWTSVYKPSIRLSTVWNYNCGSDITLSINDPRVPWSQEDPDLPGKQLAVMTIGHKISIAEIQGEYTVVKEGLIVTGEPFGGSLEPGIWFGDGLAESNITHYRWSFRKKDNINGEWIPLDRRVIRHYGEIMGDGTLTFKPYLIGPDPVYPDKKIFKIPPKNPPLNPGAVFSQWAPNADSRENSASAFFQSHLLEGGNVALAAGKYELKLELFKTNGSAAVPVNFTDDNIMLKIPTIAAPFGTGTVPTRAVPVDSSYPAYSMEDRVIRDGNGKIVAFRLVLHVDNNRCDAIINDADINGETSGPCGFIDYKSTDNVKLSFKARHPNGFARFKFRLTKGSSGNVEKGCAPGNVNVPWTALPLVSETSVDGYIRNSDGLFSKEVPVADLLGSCPRAAFSQNIYIYALATDGYNRLDYLDASAAPKPFALNPEGK